MEGLDDTGRLLAEAATHRAQMQTLPCASCGTDAQQFGDEQRLRAPALRFEIGRRRHGALIQLAAKRTRAWAIRDGHE